MKNISAELNIADGMIRTQHRHCHGPSADHIQGLLGEPALPPPPAPLRS